MVVRLPAGPAHLKCQKTSGLAAVLAIPDATGRLREIMMKIDTCTCHKIRFAQVLETARAQQITDDFEKVLEVTRCGQQCAVCHAFIRCMLATGCTEFDHYPMAYHQP